MDNERHNGCGHIDEDGIVHDARMCDGCTWSVSREACDDFRKEYAMTRIHLFATLIEGDDNVSV